MINLAGIFLSIIFIFGSNNLLADIYKCSVNGNITFSDKPCGKKQEKVVLDSLSTMQGMDEESLENANRNTEETLIKDKIKRAEEKIKSLRKDMKYELAVLKRKKRYAMNNQAGATWEESISTEMKAVTEKYKVQMDLKRDEISDLREELKNLQ